MLATGSWHKIAVKSDGIYQIDYAQLTAMGINPSSIDPTNIRLFGNGGQPLSQLNSEFRHQDLVENRIYIHGGEDGRFDEGDRIIFFGTGPDRYSLDTLNRLVRYEHNHYSEESFYFLTVAGGLGLRVETKPDAGSFTEIDRFFSYIAHERDLINMVGSGREWYGEKFEGGGPKSQDITFEFEGLDGQSPIQVSPSLMARTFEPAEFNISLGQTLIGSLTMNAVPDGTYSVRGKESADDIIVSSPGYTGNTFSVNLTYEKAGTTSAGYLKNLLVSPTRFLGQYGDQTIFQSWESLDHAMVTYRLSGTNSTSIVWDITNPLGAINQGFTTESDQIRFGTEGGEVKKFVVFSPDLVTEAPVYYGTVENQNIQGKGVANLIIVTHPDFVPEAERLAQLRRSVDGLSVHVVTTEMVFNEFSSGSPDVTAIRDYMKYLWEIDSNSLRYLLLFGKGTYDFKGLGAADRNFVPIYESRNSLHPIFSYASDDYFGFMEDGEGEWVESSSGDHTLDIGVGRIPIKSLEEATGVVNKLMRYELDPDRFGDWRNRIHFVADDQDNNLHQRQANMLADTVWTKNLNLNTRKMYLDAFEQVSLPTREVAPDANAYLDAVVDRGSLIINFTGHGNEDQWTHERILDILMIDEWKNENKLPVFITATCEFGRHDDPVKISGGERVILKEDGGAIALVTTARPVFASQNFELNDAFYQAVFENINSENSRIGDVFIETKNNSLSGSVNRNFSLLGDPSMKIAFPQMNMSVDAINDIPFISDTIRALQNVKITGSVRNQQGNVDTGFNGIADVVIFEKLTEKETLGNQTPVYLYTERDNIVFRGKATVSDGLFEVELVMPKNISTDFGNGKISIYAYDPNQGIDGAGATEDIIVGGEVQVLSDDTPPRIEAFMGDTTFVNGGLIKSNTMLVARFFDESGISVVKTSGEENIQAILDNDSVFYLHDYYYADVDDYKNGTVMIPISDLEPGPHSITVRAWDTHNNGAESTVNFTVTANGELVLGDLRNYPNPFKETTNITFSHNRPGEDLEIILQIYDRNGAIVKETRYEMYQSFTFAEGITWDGRNSSGSKLRAGLYFYKVLVRSTLDGATSQLYQKLIIY